LTVEFDKRIFGLKAVKSAVKDYGDFAKFAVSEKKDRIIVEIDSIDYEPVDVFLGELGNYVIHKMSVRQ
jgi:hypothetical protein